jgi:uncharacterized damage-inducible protein DinB
VEADVTITQFFLEQLAREAAISRRVLERVPEGRPDWKPHGKSMPLGYLANLTASMPMWIDLVVHQDALDLQPKDGPKFKPPETPTRESLLAAHEAAVAKGRAALAGTNDAFLRTRWRLLVAGQVVQEAPRDEVIADTFTHLAHHRGQLTVYLRMNELPVPSVYGPSADDKGFGQTPQP